MGPKAWKELPMHIWARELGYHVQVGTKGTFPLRWTWLTLVPATVFLATFAGVRQLGVFYPSGISQVLEHIATKFQRLSPCRYPTEIQDGGRQNEIYIFYSCMADERQFLITVSYRICVNYTVKISGGHSRFSGWWGHGPPLPPPLATALSRLKLNPTKTRGPVAWIQSTTKLDQYYWS